MYDGLLEAYGQVVWLSNKKNFDPQFLPLPGGKNTPKMPLLRVEMSKQGDNAPQNGPNLIYDSLLEVYGQVDWLSNKKNFDPQFLSLPGGKNTPKMPLFRVKR